MVAETIAKEVEAEHRGKDGQPGEDGKMWSDEKETRALIERRTPAGCTVGADAKEGEGRLREHGRTEREGGLREQGAGAVGQQVTQQDAPT